MSNSTTARIIKLRDLLIETAATDVLTGKMDKIIGRPGQEPSLIDLLEQYIEPQEQDTLLSRILVASHSIVAETLFLGHVELEFVAMLDTRRELLRERTPQPKLEAEAFYFTALFDGEECPDRAAESSPFYYSA